MRTKNLAFLREDCLVWTILCNMKCDGMYSAYIFFFSEMMDLNLRRNYTASGSLDNLHHGHHDEQSYPHYHSVLSRHRSRSVHHSTSVLDKEKSRKGKHYIKESINILPTIEDEEAKEETLKITEEAEEIAESGKHTK